MKRTAMRFALLSGLIVASATELSVPWVQVPLLPRNINAAAAIASSDMACRVARSHAAASSLASSLAVARAHPAARAQVAGYAIPADRPQAPIGRFKLTAYSGPQLGQAFPITATGTTARAGRTVAVDPRVIALGSKIYIEGLGERIAEDVGGGVKGNHIDVYVPSVEHAIRFGVQRRNVMMMEGARKKAS